MEKTIADIAQEQADDYRVLAAEERARKMEADLAKVRRELGEAAWKKILAEGT